MTKNKKKVFISTTGVQIFHKFRSYNKSLDARRATRGTFCAEGLQMLGTTLTIQSPHYMAPGICDPCFKLEKKGSPYPVIRVKLA